MPKLPDATSLGTVGTQSVMPIATYDSSVVGKAISSVGQALQGAGAQAFKANEDIRDAHAQMEVARAHSYVLQKSVDTINSFDGDPDYGTYTKRYSDSMSQVVNDAAKLIGDPQRQALFREAANQDILRGQQQLHQRARGMAADVGLTNMQQAVIANNSAALATQDPAMKARLLQENAALIDGLHNQFPEQFKATDAFKAKQEAAINGYALPQFSTRDAGQQLDLLAKKLGYTQSNGEVSAEESKNLPIAIKTAIDSQSARTGVDPDFVAKVLHIENPQMDPTAVSPTGATGLAQFTTTTAKQYGLSDRTNVADSIRAMTDKLSDDRDTLRKALGREPTDGEVYLAYQQGAAGAKALLTHPDATAVDALSTVVDRSTARKAILANGGDANMSAADFAEKWAEKLGTTATPGAQGIPTGTELDVVPYDKAMKLYEPAAQNAFFAKVDSDPKAAMAMLNTPAFSRVPEKTKTEWRKAARTAFENLEDNAKTDRIMQDTQQNQDTWNAFVDGKLLPSQLTQLESSGQVTPELANYIRTEQSKAVPRRTVMEQNDRYAELFDKYSQLGVKKDRQTGRVRSSASLEDFVDFQRDVVQAAAQGYITRDQATTFMKNITDPLQKRITDPDQSSWFTSDPNKAGYAVIDSWLKTNNMSDNKQVKGELLRRFVLNKEAAEANGSTVDVGQIAKQVTADYMKNRFPILQMMSDMPNAILPQGGGMSQIVPGPVTVKPQAVVKGDFVIGKNAKGQWAKRFKDGTFEPISTADAQVLQQQGF